MTYRERRPLLGLCPDQPTPARSRRLHVRWQSAANRAIRAFVTRALISALVSFLIVTSSVAGFDSHARPVTEPVIRIAAAYATGHLREAWNGYLAVISSVEQEARDDLLHCVSGRECPNVWHLATVVSVSRKEASSIASWCRSRRAYCDSLGVPDSLAPLVRNDRTPEDGTMLLASGGDARNIYCHLRPRVRFSSGGFTARALVDTASTHNMAFSPRARESLIHAGRPFTETTVRTGRDVVTQASVVIAPSMNIGTLEYRLMPFLLDDIEVKAHSSPQNVDTIGIATLCDTKRSAFPGGRTTYQYQRTTVHPDPPFTTFLSNLAARLQPIGRRHSSELGIAPQVSRPCTALASRASPGIEFGYVEPPSKR